MSNFKELEIKNIIEQYAYNMRESHSIFGEEWDISMIESFISDAINDVMSTVLNNKAITAYKLLKVRADKSIGPLFIGKKLKLPINVWMPATDRPTKGYAHRPGWHSTPRPEAPHLTEKGRCWYEVKIADYAKEHRPESQGGIWYLSKWMKIIKKV